jgi:hypothetical protein
MVATAGNLRRRRAMAVLDANFNRCRVMVVRAKLRPSPVATGMMPVKAGTAVVAEVVKGHNDARSHLNA